MIVLTLRTDKPQAEVGVYKDGTTLTYREWQAHRQLAETIHAEIKKVIDDVSLSLNDIDGIVIYQGPGSFTGLRIGISVANAFADSLQIPIIGSKGEEWIHQGISGLNEARNDRIVTPHYGAPANITKQKK